MSRKSLLLRRPSFIALISLAYFCVFFGAGCTDYHFGTSALYTSEIKTVFVPMVIADTYRHGLGERLTEAVCKRITERTPFDLASSKNADSTLLIRISSENQYISGLDAYNNTRQKSMIWCVTAEWQDRRGAKIAQLDPIPLSSVGISLSETEHLVAETGQSTAVVQQELIDKIADRIVGLMEEKW